MTSDFVRIWVDFRFDTVGYAHSRCFHIAGVLTHESLASLVRYDRLQWINCNQDVAGVCVDFALEVTRTQTAQNLRFVQIGKLDQIVQAVIGVDVFQLNFL